MRKRNVRKNKFSPVRLIVLLIIAASMISAFMSLPFWHIKHVIVKDNRLVPSNIIEEKAKISGDDNVFLVNYREITKRVKEIPQIKNASVYGKLPSSVIIRVEERVPYIVAVAGGKYILADDEGFIIENIENNQTSLVPAKISELPAIIGLPSSAIVSKHQIKPEIMRGIVSSLKVLSRSMDKSKFEIIMNNTEDISILIDDYQKVKLGYPSDIEGKMKVLTKILNNLGQKKSSVEYIDIRSQENPVIKFK